MASLNISQIAASTLEKRSGVLADNVSKNTALLLRLKKKDMIRPVDGGRVIYEEIEYRANSNGGWYSGWDTLPVAAQEVITAASFDLKQHAVPVVMSGLEELQNSGNSAILNLLESKLTNAEHTMINDLSASLFSDGTGSGGKELTGLDLAVPHDPTTGVYAGIDRADWSFWRSQVYDPAATPTATTIQTHWNLLWASLVRGAQKPDLIAAGTTIWATYMASMQNQQRFTDPELAQAGFTTIKFNTADVVLENYAATTTDAYFLNTNFIRLRPHKDRNMKPIGGGDGRRLPVNQDGSVTILGWAGNLTCSAAFLQGRYKGD